MMLSPVGRLVLCTVSFLGLRVLARGAGAYDNITMEDLIEDEWATQPAVPGTTPLTGLQRLPVDLRARDCLSNGTNFCFGNDVNYCLGCGVCCQDSIDRKWCCSLDSICCGTQCCAKGQSCSNGRCYLPVVSITKTSTAFITVSHRLTLVATVVENVVQTSTVNSIVQITVSSLATQTDVQWVTTTVTNARRAAPSQGAVALRDESASDRRALGALDLANVIRRVPNVFYRRSIYKDDKRSVHPRQATQPALSASPSTTTLVAQITQTVDKTSTVSSTTTRSATSTALTTAYQTATRVLNAQTTVSVTSTLTVRPPQPTTITKTEFASLPPDSAQSQSPSATSSTRTPGLAIPTGKSSADRPALSTPAIAGIAAGGAVAVLLIVGIALLICLRRRRRRRETAARVEDDLNAYYGMDIGMGIGLPLLQHRREPKLPPPDIFAQASPEHHGATFQPVVAGQQQQQQQQRAVSSHTATTLVGSGAGSPEPPAAGGTKSPRASAVGGAGLSPPAEVAGPDVPPRYEVEGSSPPVGGRGGGGGDGGWGESQTHAHRRTGSDVTGRSRRSDGGYFAVNF